MSILRGIRPGDMPVGPGHTETTILLTEIDYMYTFVAFDIDALGNIVGRCGYIKSVP